MHSKNQEALEYLKKRGLNNKTIEDVGQEIFDLIVRVASGEKSKSEIQGLGDLEFVPWQIGATM